MSQIPSPRQSDDLYHTILNNKNVRSIHVQKITPSWFSVIISTDFVYEDSGIIFMEGEGSSINAAVAQALTQCIDIFDRLVTENEELKKKVGNNDN